MNILSILHFLAFLIHCSLIILILGRDSKSPVNRVYIAFLACFALWSFGHIFLYIPGTLKDTAILFNNIASIGRISFASFFLWFTLIFTERKKILKIGVFYLIIFILPLLLIYKQWTGFLTAEYIQQIWGWKNVWSNSVWTYLFYFYYLTFTITGLSLIYDFARKTREPLKKKQIKIVFITALIALIVGTLTDVILPAFYILTIPSLANIVILIWAVGLVYAMAKYKFMIITPFTAAEKIISTMADSLILLDKEGNIVTVNEALMDLSTYTKDELTGKSIELLFSAENFKNKLLDKANKNETIRNFEFNFKPKAGKDIPILFSSSAVINEAGTMEGIVCIIKDISERKKMEEKIEKLAHLDPLTSCSNRRYGFYLIERQIKLCNRNKSPLLLAFLDIDNFKVINDTFGHHEGDRVLKELAGIFKSNLREIDIICRMGGDEFLLVFPGSSLQEALIIRRRLDDRLSQINQGGKRGYQVTYSIGFSEYRPENPISIDELISIADQRMYEDKENTKNYFRKSNIIPG